MPTRNAKVAPASLYQESAVGRFDDVTDINDEALEGFSSDARRMIVKNAL
jgi:hypothetical protein